MKSDAWRLGLLCSVLFLAAISTRVFLVVSMHLEPHIEFAELELVAKSLAESWSLSNPYSLPTGPSAHHAPLYPSLLSCIFRGLGYGRTAAWAMIGMNIAFASAQYALLPALANRGGVPISVGALAATLGVIPFRIMKEIRWETPMNGLLLVLCTFAAVHWIRNLNSRRFRLSIGTGLFFGLAMVAVPMYLPVLFVLASAIIMRAGRLRSPWLFQQAMTLLLCSAIGVSPWIVRNYLQFRTFVFVRSNYPLEFSLSNHDGVSPLAVENYSIGFPNNFMTLRHPWSNQKEARLVQQLGEIPYNRARFAEGIRWCSQNKGHFARLTLQRFLLFWFPVGGAQPIKSLWLAGITLAGLVGAALMQVRQDSELRIPLLAALIGFPLPYYLIQVDTRYRYPLDWCIYLLAAYLASNSVFYRTLSSPLDRILRTTTAWPFMSAKGTSRSRAIAGQLSLVAPHSHGVQ